MYQEFCSKIIGTLVGIVGSVDKDITMLTELEHATFACHSVEQ